MKNHLLNKLNILSYWLPPLLWMLLIFYLSSRPRFSITREFMFDFVIFKGLHIAEYALLYFLLFRAYFKSTHESQRLQGFFFAFVVASLYAITDEMHQTLVPTREGRVRDIFIDLVGISIAYVFIKNNLDFVRQRLLKT